MDSSRALLALDELAKWRKRKRRVEERLRTVRAQKASLVRELEAVQARIAQLSARLSALQGVAGVRPPVLPPQPGVIR